MRCETFKCEFYFSVYIGGTQVVSVEWVFEQGFCNYPGMFQVILDSFTSFEQNENLHV